MTDEIKKLVEEAWRSRALLKYDPVSLDEIAKGEFEAGAAFAYSLLTKDAGEFDEKTFIDWWESTPGVVGPWCPDVIEKIKEIRAGDKARIAALKGEVEMLRGHRAEQAAR